MIAILDYGVGNLRSVYKAFETVAGPLGVPVDIVDKPTDLTRWRAVVLPGQGAFGDSVDNLRRQQLAQPLLDAVQAGLPLLGICVGMQLLFDSSEEMGDHEGLHLIPGAVRRFPDAWPTRHRLATRCACRRSAGTNSTSGRPTPCSLMCPMARTPTSPIATTVTPRSSAVLATTDYGIDYPSIVRYRNAWGIQPHPEKSHTVGLRILANFMRMVQADGTLRSRSDRSVIEYWHAVTATFPSGRSQQLEYSSSKGVME